MPYSPVPQPPSKYMVRSAQSTLCPRSVRLPLIPCVRKAWWIFLGYSHVWIRGDDRNTENSLRWILTKGCLGGLSWLGWSKWWQNKQTNMLCFCLRIPSIDVATLIQFFTNNYYKFISGFELCEKPWQASFVPQLWYLNQYCSYQDQEIGSSNVTLYHLIVFVACNMHVILKTSFILWCWICIWLDWYQHQIIYFLI